MRPDFARAPSLTADEKRRQAIRAHRKMHARLLYHTHASWLRHARNRYKRTEQISSMNDTVSNREGVSSGTPARIPLSAVLGHRKRVAHVVHVEI